MQDPETELDTDDESNHNSYPEHETEPKPNFEPEPDSDPDTEPDVFHELYSKKDIINASNFLIASVGQRVVHSFVILMVQILIHPKIGRFIKKL